MSWSWPADGWGRGPGDTRLLPACWCVDLVLGSLTAGPLGSQSWCQPTGGQSQGPGVLGLAPAYWWVRLISYREESKMALASTSVCMVD